VSDSNVERLPSILIVDDKPEEVRRIEELLRGQASTEVRHPQDVTNDDLAGADLILVDYLLQDWPERDGIYSLSLRPMNGLALAGVYRAHLTSEEKGAKVDRRSPTAIALHSGHLQDVAGDLPPEIRPYAVARANNLEWAFEKAHRDGTRPSLSDQLVSLADGVRRLPPEWPRDPAEVNESAKQFFALSSNEPWAERAWAEIEDCHPPLHELSTATHGLALLRWMLQRILPYPCFLLDDWYFAARLQIDYSEFVAILESPGFIEHFDEVKYVGPLSDFLGPRWWRAGVEALLWTLTEGRSFDAGAILQQLVNLTSLPLRQESSAAAPLVCLNESYTPLEKFCSADKAVRIQPDDWPSYAQQAWTTIELALELPLLQSLVVHEDRDRLVSAVPEDSDEKAK
jgi:hypothetical protein